MKADFGDNVVDLLGIELPTWTIYAATGLVGLLFLQIALKPKPILTAPSPSPSTPTLQNRDRNG